MNNEGGRHVRDHRNRREILDRVVRQLAHHRRIDHMGCRHQEQRVTVRRRARSHLRADRSTRAAAIVDDDRLAEHLDHFWDQDARDDIGVAARGERDDQPNGLLRKLLRHRRRQDHKSAHHRRDKKQSNPRAGHGGPHCLAYRLVPVMQAYREVCLDMPASRRTRVARDHRATPHGTSVGSSHTHARRTTLPPPPPPPGSRPANKTLPRQATNIGSCHNLAGNHPYFS